MTHYRQIIVNLSVDDDAPEETLEELAQQVKICIEKNSNEKIQEVRIVLN